MKYEEIKNAIESLEAIHNLKGLSLLPEVDLTVFDKSVIADEKNIKYVINLIGEEGERGRFFYNAEHKTFSFDYQTDSFLKLERDSETIKALNSIKLQTLKLNSGTVFDLAYIEEENKKPAMLRKTSAEVIAELKNRMNKETVNTTDKMKM